MADNLAQLTGADAVLANLATLATRLPVATAEFMEREADDIYEKSQQLVPRDTNELAESGEVIRPGGRLTGGVVRSLLPRGERGRFVAGGITIRYGQKGAVDFAHVVHEHPSPHDPPTWHGKKVHFTTGGPKFLERPFRAAVGTLWSRLATHLRGQLR